MRRLVGGVDCNHSDNTNIDKCDKKYFIGCDHSLPGFVCQFAPYTHKSVKKWGLQYDVISKNDYVDDLLVLFTQTFDYVNFINLASLVFSLVVKKFDRLRGSKGHFWATFPSLQHAYCLV